jgi:hypothetical protein
LTVLNPGQTHSPSVERETGLCEEVLMVGTVEGERNEY